MLNNEIFITPSLSNNAPVARKLTVSGASATDDNVPTNYAWKITSTGDGYDYIWQEENGVKYYIRSVYDSGDNHTLVYTTNPNDTGTKWAFCEYTGSAIDGVVESTQCNLVLLNTTADYDAYMYSSTVGRNGPIIYSVSERDYSPTTKATIDSSTGVLTPVSGGIVRVKWTYNGSPWVWSRLVTINFEDGIVHTLKNVSQNKLMKPMTEGPLSSIEVKTYDYNNITSMWKYLLTCNTCDQNALNSRLMFYHHND